MVEVLERGLGAHEIKCKSCDSKLRYHDGEIKKRQSLDYRGDISHRKVIECPVCAQDVRII